MPQKQSLNFPTTLTLIRLIVSPIMLPLLIVYMVPFNQVWLNAILATLFLLFALTDFFDGFLARRLKQETAMGRVLDPLADKFLVYPVLIALLAVNKIYFYWVIILIAREFFVLGIRQMSLEQGFTIHVSFLAKIKTMVQMALVTMLILNPYQAQGFAGNGAIWNASETLLLVLTIWLAITSAYGYYGTYVGHIKIKQDNPHD